MNGYRVDKIMRDEKENITDICYCEKNEGQFYSIGDIKLIVTKQQMEAIQYVVE